VTKTQEFDADSGLEQFAITPRTIDAVARFLYGQAEYDALFPGDQAKEAYRKRARELLKLAADEAHPS